MRWRFLALFLLGVLIVLAVFWVSGPEAVIRDMLKFSLKYFCVLLFLQLVIMFLWALKLRIVLRHSNVSLRNVVAVSFTGYFVNNLTPVNLAGGEPVMAYLLPKVDRNINTERSAAGVIINTFLTVFPVVSFILIAILLGLRHSIPFKLAVVLLAGGCAVSLAFLAILMLFIKEEYSRRLITFVINFLKKVPVDFLREHAIDAEKRVDRIIENFNDSMHKTMADKSILASGILLSSIIWFLYFFQTYIIFQFIGYPVAFETILIVKIATIVIGFLSITPGAVGIWEGISTWLFSLYSIPASTAAAAVFIERLFTFWIGSFIGFLAMAYLGASYLLEKYV